MSRLFSLLLIGLFSISTIEVPIAVAKPAKSCCCKQAICHCDHGSNSHSFCHFPKKAAREPQAVSLKENTPINSPVFNPAGCGSREEHTASPSYSKEFYVGLSAVDSLAAPPDFLTAHPEPKLISVFTTPLDRPPITPHAI